MKKLLAVFMAALVLFSSFAVAVMAEETAEVPETTTAVAEESITNADGLVVPENFNQLKSSIIFKIFEKIISFILSLFGGEAAPEADNEAATAIDGIAGALDERLSDLFA